MVSMKPGVIQPVTYPPLDDQLAIVTMLGEIKYQSERLIDAYLKKLDMLDELKKSILHRAFSGELIRNEEAAA